MKGRPTLFLRFSFHLNSLTIIKVKFSAISCGCKHRILGDTIPVKICLETNSCNHHDW